MSGSDDGSFFIWEKETTNLVRILQGDESIVNCLQPHPSYCFLATSGIDPVVRLWNPRPEVNYLFSTLLLSRQERMELDWFQGIPDADKFRQKGKQRPYLPYCSSILPSILSLIFKFLLKKKCNFWIWKPSRGSLNVSARVLMSTPKICDVKEFSKKKFTDCVSFPHRPTVTTDVWWRTWRELLRQISGEWTPIR